MAAIDRRHASTAASDLGNAAISDALEELGDLYELDGAVIHRVLAYRTAARSIRDAPVSVAALTRAGRATELRGVGKTIEAKVLALLEAGTIPAAERLRQRYPPGLVAITRLPGLGAKRARTLFDTLGIDSPQALREAAEAHRLQTAKGFGAKFEQRVLDALTAAEGQDAHKRVLLPRALEIAEAIVAGLMAAAPAKATIEIAGSARRRVDAVKDIDLVAVSDDPSAVADAMAQVSEIERVLSASPTSVKAMTHMGLAVDLRIGLPSEHGSLLQHFTGSAAHNAALRALAAGRGLHVSEHGIEDERTGRSAMCATEEEVYDALGLAWIEPELREDDGELEAAQRGGAARLPKLLREQDILGDLHCHTIASDGHATVEEMASAAAARGYEYLAITDHSASHGFGNAVSPDELRAQIEHVRACDAAMPQLKLLAGSEVNILPDGSLDYEDELLAQLDWVIASVHTSFRMAAPEMTKRMIAAIEHPFVDAIAHPTGRLIERRTAYAFDLDAVLCAAARSRTMLEINANPDRRDLRDAHAKAAARAGVLLVINSDAHRPHTLANMSYGVATARRAWLRKREVANTRGWQELKGLRKRNLR